MEYIEYNEENANLKNLEASFLSENLYKQIHESTVIVCHDIFIRYNNTNQKGILLVQRLREPAKNVLWPIGGRLLRGKSAEESLSLKVLSECGLTLKNIQYLGVARTFFGGEPFGHTHGTDTLNLVYIADGEGTLLLDTMHTSATLITRELYAQKYYILPKYVEQFLSIIEKSNLWE